MTLDQAKIGEEYLIHEIAIAGSMKKRLEALGMIQGTAIVVLNRKRNGTLIYKMSGTRYAIGKKIAQKIEVREGEYDE